MTMPCIKILAAGFALAITGLTTGYKEWEWIPTSIHRASAFRQASTGVGSIKMRSFDPLVLKTEIDKFLIGRNLSGYAYAIFVDGQWVEAAGGQGGQIRKA